MVVFLSHMTVEGAAFASLRSQIQFSMNIIIKKVMQSFDNFLKHRILRNDTFNISSLSNILGI